MPEIVTIEKEYDHQPSEEAISDLCEANEYLFDQYGNIEGN